MTSSEHPPSRTSDARAEVTETPQRAAWQGEGGRVDDAGQPTGAVDRLIDQWFAEGTPVGMIIGELMAPSTDEGRAEELFDLVFEDEAPAPDLFTEPVVEIDEHGQILSIPKRPLNLRWCGAALAVVLGWALWGVLFPPEHAERPPDAMAGVTNHQPAVSQPVPAHVGAQTPLYPSEEANYSGEAIPLGVPKKGEWLYHFPERGQTYHHFLAEAAQPRDPKRNVLYVMSLGYTSPEHRKILKATMAYLGAYYDTPTRELPARQLPIDAYAPSRHQYHARAMLEVLSRDLPDDALGMIAMTEADLYIPSLNYVFGLGSRKLGVAVFSVGRYGDDVRLHGDPESVLRRSMTVAAHEIGHVVAMRHCTAYHCIMNGTSSLREADEHPLHLCPVCVRKAEHAFEFERTHRYKRLLEFYTAYPGFEEEAAFVRRRLNPPPMLHVPHL